MENKPSILVLLGDIIAIDTGDHDWQFGKNEAWLTATPNGKELWIIPKKTGLPKADKKSKIGQSLFRQFTGWKADKNYNYSLSQKKMILIGSAKSISYRSDKWDRKKRGYIHEFESQTKIYADSKTNPTIFKITGNFWITSRGIEG